MKVRLTASVSGRFFKRRVPRPVSSRWMDAIARLARASELEPLAGEMPKGA